jgi:hypothetical protein
LCTNESGIDERTLLEHQSLLAQLSLDLFKGTRCFAACAQSFTVAPQSRVIGLGVGKAKTAKALERQAIGEHRFHRLI